MPKSKVGWTVGIQEPCQTSSGSIIIENEVVVIRDENENWIAIVGKVGNANVLDNAKVMAASKELLTAAHEAYNLLAIDSSNSSEVRDKLFQAIQKATK